MEKHEIVGRDFAVTSAVAQFCSQFGLSADLGLNVEWKKDLQDDGRLSEISTMPTGKYAHADVEIVGEKVSMYVTVYKDNDKDGSKFWYAGGELIVRFGKKIFKGFKEKESKFSVIKDGARYIFKGNDYDCECTCNCSCACAFCRDHHQHAAFLRKLNK